jgi:hypothetical protein
MMKKIINSFGDEKVLVISSTLYSTGFFINKFNNKINKINNKINNNLLNNAHKYIHNSSVFVFILWSTRFFII